MTITKKNISKEVSKRISVPEKDGEALLNQFLSLVKKNSKNFRKCGDNVFRQ